MSYLWVLHLYVLGVHGQTIYIATCCVFLSFNQMINLIDPCRRQHDYSLRFLTFEYRKEIELLITWYKYIKIYKVDMK